MASKVPPSSGDMKQRSRRYGHRAGFGVAPILYMLGLVGVGAGVLFSGYSQILHSNQQITNDLAAKSDLNSAATTMAATGILGVDGTTFCPPVGVQQPTSPCQLAPIKMVELYPSNNVGADTKLPTNWANASTGASPPVEVGIFAAASGVKQIDPYGHYYLYCRWESNATSSLPSIQVITAGPDGKLDTKCGDTAPSNDDTINLLSASVAVNRSSVWQQVPIGTNVEAQYGQTGHQLTVDNMGNLSTPGSGSFGGGLTVSSGSTTVGQLTAGASTLNSLVTTNGATIGSGLTVNTGGGLIKAGGLTITAGGLTVSAGTTTIQNLVAGAGGFSSLNVTGGGTFGGALSVTAGGLTVSSGTTNLVDLVTSGSVTVGNGLQVNAGQTLVTDFNATGISTVGALYATTLQTSGTATLNSAKVTNGITGKTIVLTGTASMGTTTINGDLGVTGTITGNFAGTISGGTINVGTGGATFSGVVPIANGGTGASSSSTALFNLGVTTAGGILNTGLIGANSITSAMMAAPGASVATYYSVQVDSAGRVTGGTVTAPNNSLITDGTDTVATGTSEISFIVGSSTVGIWNSTGLSVGTNVVAGTGSKLDVDGNIRIEGSAGTATPNQLQLMTGAASERWALTTDGVAEGAGNAGSDFVLKSYDNSGAAIANLPFTLTRTGNLSIYSAITAGGNITSTAGAFYGSGAGLTNIPGGQISGTIGSGNIGAAGSDKYLQYNNHNGLGADNKLAWDYTNSRLGIGTSSPLVSLDVSMMADAIGLPVGATGTRPAASATGYMRFNTDLTKVEVYDGSNWTVVGNGGGGSGTPGGSNKQIQYNASGTFAGDTLFVWDYTSHFLGVGTATPANRLDVNGSIGVGSYAGTAAPTAGSIIMSGQLGIGTSSPASALDLSKTSDALALPVGAAASRPTTTVTNGMIRYNNSGSGQIEGYINSQWVSLLSTGSSISGGSVTAAGNVGTMQFNNNPYLGGASAVTYSTTTNALTITSQAATNTPFVLVGAASQTGDLVQWQNSSNAVLGKITSSGSVYLPVAHFTGTAGGSGSGTITGTLPGSLGQVIFNNSGNVGAAANLVYNVTGNIVTTSANLSTDIPLTVQGASSQSADLQDWVNSSGSVLSKMDKSGNLAIGTTTSKNALDVNGSVAVGSYAGSVTGTSGNLIVSGSVAVGTSVATTALQVNGTVTATNYAGSMPASIISGVISPSNLGTGTADSTKYLTGAGTWQTLPGGAGDVTFSANQINLNNASSGIEMAFNYSGKSNIPFTFYNGAAVAKASINPYGVSYFNGGNVAIGETSSSYPLEVSSATADQAHFISTGSNRAEILVDNAAGGQQSLIGFLDATNTKWQLGKQTDNSFIGYDFAHTANFMTVGTNGLVTLGESGQMSLPASGSVGIGTTNPGAKLDVAGAARASSLTSNITTGALVMNVGSTNGSTGSPALALWGTSDSSYPGAVHLITQGGNIQFFNYNGTTWSELMRITSAGNVGIGTAVPTQNLDVYTGGMVVRGASGVPASGNGLVIDFGGLGGANTGSIQGYDYGVATARNLVLEPAGGNVSIGTTSTGYLLNVNGTSNFVGAMNLNTNFQVTGNQFNMPATQCCGEFAFNYGGAANMNFSIYNGSAGITNKLYGSGGAWFNGNITANSVSLNTYSIIGNIAMNQGDATHPGYLSFYNAAGTRVGYIGWQGNTNYLSLETENGYAGYQVTGNLIVNSNVEAGNICDTSGNNCTSPATIAAGVIVASSLGANGYVKYGNGYIHQWGVGTTAANTTTCNVTFPIAFPNALVSFTSQIENSSTTFHTMSGTCQSKSAINVTAGQYATGAASGYTFFWMADGY